MLHDRWWRLQREDLKVKVSMIRGILGMLDGREYLHMLTMLPCTLLPYERYPVMATRMYTLHAVPMLAMTTPVVRKWELFLISLSMENI